ncbi:hypothetical protein [Oleiharenicola lentus]|uniref:hypothetical protein n=1 Tax=Oleiharenicola lentus TaxID=2508720 RepID=UPI003F678FCD
MTKADFTYRKLTRMRRTIGMMAQLWLGPDHLLQVQSTGYTEKYQRFYLRDIQSLQVVHTARRLYIALTFGAIALIAVLIAIGNYAQWPVYAWIAGLIAPFLVWNQVLGPCCRVVIVTAVQQEKLPALSRLAKTRRVIAELQPLIEGAQADLVAPAATPVSNPSPEVPPVSLSPRNEPPALPPPLPLP